MEKRDNAVKKAAETSSKNDKQLAREERLREQKRRMGMVRDINRNQIIKSYKPESPKTSPTKDASHQQALENQRNHNNNRQYDDKVSQRQSSEKERNRDKKRTESRSKENRQKSQSKTKTPVTVTKVRTMSR